MLPQVIPRLEDTNCVVRRGAVEVFARLPAKEVVKVLPQVMPRLKDSDDKDSSHI